MSCFPFFTVGLRESEYRGLTNKERVYDMMLTEEQQIEYLEEEFLVICGMAFEQLFTIEQAVDKILASDYVAQGNSQDAEY